jgi:hypothetical protein
LEKKGMDKMKKLSEEGKEICLKAYCIAIGMVEVVFVSACYYFDKQGVEYPFWLYLLGFSPIGFVLSIGPLIRWYRKK